MSNSDSSTVSFTWHVEHFAFCVEQKTQSIVSPTFVVKGCRSKTKWHLLLYPRGIEDENVIALYLKRETGDRGSDCVSIDFELSIVSQDGLVLKTVELKDHAFVRGHGYGIPTFSTREEVVEDKSSFLNDGTLSINCRIWGHDSTVAEDLEYVARTIIGVERGTFDWAIKDFSKLPSNQCKYIIVDTKQNSPMTVEFSMSGGYQSDRRVHIDINRQNVSRKCFCTCAVSVLNVRNMPLDSTTSDFFFEVGESKQVWHLPTFLWKGNLMSKRTLYLPEDVLTLRFEFILSTGVEQSTIESKETFCNQPGDDRYNVGVETPLERSDDFCDVGVGASFPKKHSSSEMRDFQRLRDVTRVSENFVQNIKFMYENGLLSDFKLRAGNVVFPVHKCILSARSEVFVAMFTNEMMEKTGDSQDIPDVDADTMHKLLAFTYTDDVQEDMNWESASKLYFAADKYAMHQLRQRCSVILQNKLEVSSVCHVLKLADLHRDDGLKEASIYFMMRNDLQILQSKEWKNFERRDMELAIETLREVYLKKLNISSQQENTQSNVDNPSFFNTQAGS